MFLGLSFLICKIAVMMMVPISGTITEASRWSDPCKRPNISPTHKSASTGSLSLCLFLIPKPYHLMDASVSFHFRVGIWYWFKSSTVGALGLIEELIICEVLGKSILSEFHLSLPVKFIQVVKGLSKSPDFTTDLKKIQKVLCSLICLLLLKIFSFAHTCCILLPLIAGFKIV